MNGAERDTVVGSGSLVTLDPGAAKREIARQPLIVSHTGEFRCPEHRAFPFGDLNPLHATPSTHGCPPARTRQGRGALRNNLAVNIAIMVGRFAGAGPSRNEVLLVDRIA
jgi:hypothetical protein